MPVLKRWLLSNRKPPFSIPIGGNGRFVPVEVSAEIADYLEQAKRNNRKLYRERQRYWDGREYDEYIIATEGRLP